MISQLAIKMIAGVVFTAVLSGGIYSLEQHIENIGYTRAKAEDAIVIKQIQDDADKKFDQISASSNELAKEFRINIGALQSDISTIVKNSKGKAFVIVKNGECTPTSTFSDSFSEINKRVNQTIKDSQK